MFMWLLYCNILWFVVYELYTDMFNTFALFTSCQICKLATQSAVHIKKLYLQLSRYLDTIVYIKDSAQCLCQISNLSNFVALTMSSLPYKRSIWLLSFPMKQRVRWHWLWSIHQLNQLFITCFVIFLFLLSSIVIVLFTAAY